MVVSRSPALAPAVVFLYPAPSSRPPVYVPGPGLVHAVRVCVVTVSWAHAMGRCGAKPVTRLTGPVTCPVRVPERRDDRFFGSPSLPSHSCLIAAPPLFTSLSLKCVGCIACMRPCAHAACMLLAVHAACLPLASRLGAGSWALRTLELASSCS